MTTPIRDVLAAHDRYRRHSPLVKNLGDGYLYAKNPVFRAIRDQLVAERCTFSTRAFPAYAASAHTALPTILETACIPYVDNRTALAAIHAACPDMTMEELPDLRRNHVFHEGAHLLAYRAFDQAALGTRGARARQQLVLAVLAGEAFATTCETIGWAFAQTDLDRALYRINAVPYSREQARLPADLARTFDLLGLETGCRLFFFGFLCANFLFDALGPDEFATLFASVDPSASLDPDDARFLNSVVNAHCFTSLDFRMFYTQAHFRMLGVSTPIVELVQFDFLSVLERTPRLRRGLDTLLGILTRA